MRQLPSSYFRIEDTTAEALSREEIAPIVLSAMERLHSTVKNEYGDSLLTPQEATEYALNELHLAFINGEFLFGYSLCNEWFSRRLHMYEEVLIRVREGTTSLKEVFNVALALKNIHGAEGVCLHPSSAALKRLYKRYGAEELLTTMRIT